MTVKELIKKLSKLNTNLLVIKSKDAEGNGYETVDGLSKGSFYEKYEEFKEESEWQRVDDENIEKDDRYIPCVCLW